MSKTDVDPQQTNSYSNRLLKLKSLILNKNIGKELKNKRINNHKKLRFYDSNKFDITGNDGDKVNNDPFILTQI